MCCLSSRRTVILHTNIFLTILFYSLSCVDTIAQNIRLDVQNYSIDDGLSERYIHSTFQDSKGFIWAATQFKVNRFDGNEFRHYGNQENGLSTNTVFKILEDKNEMLWFFYFSEHVDKVHPQRNIVEVFDPIEERSQKIDQFFDLPFQMNQVKHYGTDDEKNIWLLLNDGSIYKYDGQRFQLIFVANEPIPNEFVVSKNNKIGTIADSIFTIYDLGGKLILREKFNFLLKRLTCDYYGDFWIDESKLTNITRTEYAELWKCKDGQASELFPLKHNDRQSVIMKAPYGASSAYHDREGRIWTHYGANLMVFDKEGELLLEELGFFDNINLSEFHDIIFDNENKAWISHRYGLTSITLKPIKFRNYMTLNNLQNIRGIVVDESKNIYVNNSGLRKIDVSSKGIYEMLTGNPRNGLIQDRMGKLWAGANSSSIESYDPKTKLIETYRSSKYGLRMGDGYGVRVLLEDKQINRIWLGTTDKGIAFVNASKKKLELYNGYNEFEELRKSRISHLYENDEGIWIASNKGIYLMDAVHGVQKRFNQKDFDSALHIYEDKEGIFWIATFGNGLLRWDRTTNVVQQFTITDGLSHNIIYAVYEDDFGFLWIPGNNGLMRFNKQNKVISNFLPKDGIPHKEFNYTSHFEDDDGQLFFGGLGGITSFYPKDFLQNDNQNLLNNIQVLSYEKLDVATGDNLDLTKQFLEESSIHLTPSDRSFYLRFQLPYFNPHEKIKYLYKIQGVQDQWSLIEENFIRINGLPYGDYTLHLKAQNSKAQETVEVLKIPIFVEKPVHLKTWFLILMFILVSAIVLAFFRWRTYQLKKDKKRLEQEVSRRTETIADQNETLEIQKETLEKTNEELQSANAMKNRLFAIIGHDLKAPLFSLQGLEDQINYLLETGQIERLKQLGHSMERSTRFLSNTLNNLLNWSMNQMGKFPYHPKNIKVQEIVQQVFGLFEGNAKAKEINLISDIPNHLSLFADENALHTILRNLVSNAIKFTPKCGEIIISGRSDNGVTHLYVEDSGDGMSDEQIKSLLSGNIVTSIRGIDGEKGTGLGLMLCRDLLNQNKGRFDINNEDEKTTFCIQLPSQESTEMNSQ